MSKETFKERMRRNRERRLKIKMDRLEHWEDKENLVKEFSKQEALTAKRERVKESIQQEKKILDDWVKNNDHLIPTQRYMDSWVNVKKKYQPLILDITVRQLALLDAISEANKTLAVKFNLTDAGVDESEIETILRKTFRVEMLTLLLKDSTLHPKYKQDIIRRFISKEYPYRDNVPAAPPKTLSPQDIKHVVDEGIRMEVEKYNRDG